MTFYRLSGKSGGGQVSKLEFLSGRVSFAVPIQKTTIHGSLALRPVPTSGEGLCASRHRGWLELDTFAVRAAMNLSCGLPLRLLDSVDAAGTWAI